MFKLIEGKYLQTQGYGLTEFAKSPQGKQFYKGFAGGIHPGLDFGTRDKNDNAGIKSKVYSSCDGKVVKAGPDGGWGNHVEVQCADGWNRQYAHLSSVAVKVGQEVKRGDHIGNVGSTGSSTAVHLHYGHRQYDYIRFRWVYRDPSIDLEDVIIKEPKPITSKLIKGNKTNSVYIYNGKEKFGIPSMNTLTFLFGENPKIEVIDEAIITKIPERETIPLIQ
jgi:murein DD-endopeptidase MepM/ murein hydrolase activator NlpD